MLSKNTLKWLRSLKLKKNRDREDKVIVEGSRIIKDLLRQRSINVHRIYVRENLLGKFKMEFPEFAELSDPITEKELKAVSAFKSIPDSLLVCQKPKESPIVELKKTGYFIFLDILQDPGNLGAIFRTAEWFGINGIILSSGTVQTDNSKLIQSSMGAVFRVPWATMEFDNLKQIKPDLSVFGAYMKGESIYDTTFPESGILVIGNEGKGISDIISGQIDKKVTIPAAFTNQSESLNAGIAAAIMMSEVFRNS